MEAGRHEDARCLLAKGAHRHDPGALLALGDMMQQGLGGEADPAAADRLLSLAILRGDRDGRNDASSLRQAAAAGLSMAKIVASEAVSSEAALGTATLRRWTPGALTRAAAPDEIALLEPNAGIDLKSRHRPEEAPAPFAGARSRLRARARDAARSRGPPVG